MSREKAKNRDNRAQVNGYSGILESLSGNRLGKIFKSFADNNIVIVGDIMLDRYLWGDCSRISPEAPVPVVEIDREEHLLGVHKQLLPFLDLK